MPFGVMDGNSSKKYPVNAGVSQGLISSSPFLLLYINEFPDDVICNFAIHDDDTTLYYKCDQVPDLRHQLELGSELESHL